MSIEKYFNQEISHKELINSISTDIEAMSYYKFFGHTGIFDELLVNTYFEYMLAYPQIYFQKTYHTDYPIHIQSDSKYYDKFSSKFYTEPFKPESFHLLNKFPNFMSTKIFINPEGNFSFKSNTFQHVANFKGQLYIPSEKTLEKLSKK